MKVCITYFPDDYPAWIGPGPFKPLFHLLVKASCYRRNPRGIKYMKSLADEFFGTNYKLIDSKNLSIGKLKEEDEIVLLWPDGNGYSWFRIEQKIFKWKKDSAKLYVLNGRRRYFPLSRSLWRAYLLRRVVERYWVGELLFMPLFLIMTYFFLAFDLLRGRR